MKHSEPELGNRFVGELDPETADDVILGHAQHVIAAKHLGRSARVLKRDTVRLLLREGLRAVKNEGWENLLKRTNGTGTTVKKAAASKSGG